jgi:ribosome-binding factor A
VAIPFRREKLGAQIQKEISAIVRTEMSDPRVRPVTVTRVLVSSDLKYAKVFVAALGDKKKVKLALDALKRAGGFLQGELGRRMRLREVPELSFRADDAIDKAFKMNKLFKQIEKPGDEKPGGEEE